MPSKTDPADPQFDSSQAAEALRWWIRAGVDLALDEAPHNRFKESAERSPGSHPGVHATSPQQDAAKSDTREPVPRFAGTNGRREAGPVDSRTLAATATDLEALRSLMADFDGCALKRTATQLVFADGAPGSAVMFVGEAPGGDEDRIGRPFVGRAGQLLDRMLAAIGLDRGHVYIANVVPWRPPGNRTPTLEETQICLPFIRRQIELADPEILVCLGGSAAQTLLGVRGGILRARGSWFDYAPEGARPRRALAMLHPAYLLRQPAHKRLAWADLRALASELKAAGR
jgi:DNA polymerase